MPHLRICPAALALLLALTGCARADAGEAADCVPTEADSLGPFYVSGTPLLDDLNRHGKPGEALLLTGRIRSAAGERPAIAAAQVEIWQTDGEGDYHPRADGDVADYDDAEIDLRGTVITGADGNYSLRTLVPGGYFPRPRHFHYRISAPGHATLVTQLYITGDGLLGQAGGDCRHASLETTPEGLGYRAPDIYLVAE